MHETLKELAGELAVIHEALERAEVIERQLPAYLRELEAERDQLRAEVERLKEAGRIAVETWQFASKQLAARCDEAEAERDEARKENDFMRLRLAESDKACVYCSLPKAEMGACASGFPGCARADELFQCDELTRRDAHQRLEAMKAATARAIAAVESAPEVTP